MDKHSSFQYKLKQDEEHSERHRLESVLTPKKSPKKKFNKNRALKAFLKPVLFAVILGGIFGFSIMHFFSDLNPSAIPVDQPSQEEQDEGSTEATEASTGAAFQFEFPEASVVQLGIFSSRENAEVFSQQLNVVPSAIVEKDQQFYLINSLLLNDSMRTQVEGAHEGLGLVYMEDFLVKDWSFSVVNKEVGENEQQWLQKTEFLTNPLAESDLASVKQWINDAPDIWGDNERLKAASTQLGLYEQNASSEKSDLHLQTAQLNLWLFLEEIGEN
ncbi:hypothetical protein CEY16_05065 [Halalkalibacillus sediminis]|uniref:SPOR domain-containing protein n=1 Tax=Halalkalibacillus sediminis TaxID=2018042 RepID=A0A2I0QXR7_9BACI|nr:hypothetical protein [Halalkalibacillus sediminis]PKR79124.1 hypothetical protein CEY16_05065 [Halalkalibacillus sediminis]